MLLVGDEAYVILSACIFDGRCPRTATVAEFTVQKIRLVIVFELVINVGDNLPVDEVGTVHHRHTGQKMHRSAGHIIIIAHPDNVGIGDVTIDYGVGSSDRAGATGACTKKYRQQGCQYEDNSIVFHIRGCVLFLDSGHS